MHVTVKFFSSITKISNNLNICLVKHGQLINLENSTHARGGQIIKYPMCTDIEGVINKRWNGSDSLTKRGCNLHKIAESVNSAKQH